MPRHYTAFAVILDDDHDVSSRPPQITDLRDGHNSIALELIDGVTIHGTPQQMCAVLTQALRAAKPYLAPVVTPAETAARGIAECRSAQQAAS